MMRFARPLLAAAALAALATSARAQLAPPTPDQKDLPLDARTRTAVLDTLVQALHDRYVFPEVANALDREIRQRQKRGAFNAITSSEAFADTLTSLLRAVGKDRHFRVGYRERPIPRFADDGPPPEDEARRQREAARRSNYGFERVQRLGGNVGYLEIRGFQPAAEPAAGAAAAAAMNFLANCDALVIDVRRNPGGSPDMVQLVSTWLFPAGDPTHLNDLVFRDGGVERVESFYTLPWVPGQRSPDKDVYVLTSRGTGSAAEEFTYNLKNLKRATVVGDTTVGAANPGGFVRLADHFAAFISNGRARNPVSKTNWEGVGVIPDLAVKPVDALKTAHLAALRRLIEKEDDAERKRQLERALADAEATPPEPWSEPRAMRAKP